MVVKGPGTTLEDPMAVDFRPDLRKSTHDITEYLEEQDAYVLFDGILKELATQQPADPIQHMLDYLQAGHPIGGPLKVVVMRPPGAGLSDQVVKLAETFGLVHISTGALLKEAKIDTSKGELVDDKMVAELVVKKMQEATKQMKGFVLEGFPRTRVQTTYLKEHSIVPTHILALKASMEMVLANAGEGLTDLPAVLNHKYGLYQCHSAAALEAYQATDKIRVIDCANFAGPDDSLQEMITVVREQPRSKGPQLPHRVVVLGPRGVGVRAHAERLATRLGAVCVDGARLVQAAAKPQGKRDLVAPLVGNQKLELTGMNLPNLPGLSAEDTLGLVGVRLRQPDCVRNGWVLCGFPTTKELATALATDDDLAPLRIINLNASQETCLGRLRHRYIDTVTGEIWTTMPLEGAIRSRLKRNPEDMPNVVSANYEAHYSTVQDVLAALQSGPKVRRCLEIEADGSPAAVFQQLMEFVERPLPLPEPGH